MVFLGMYMLHTSFKTTIYSRFYCIQSRTRSPDIRFVCYYLQGSSIVPDISSSATLFPNQTSFVPTVTDNAFWQGLVPEHSIGIFFAPTGSMDGVTNGEIHFGGADSSKYTGELNYVYVTMPLFTISVSLRPLLVLPMLIRGCGDAASLTDSHPFRRFVFLSSYILVLNFS